MARLFGRAPRGERVIGTVPKNYGSNLTLVGALSLEGMDVAASFPGPTDGDVFRAFTKELLAPSLSLGDVVVMDNLASHKVKGIREAIEEKGARLMYLPPYSPDFAPIEQCWSKVKMALRKARARTKEKLGEAVVQALAGVTSSNAKGWFLHSGYSIRST